VRTTQAYRPDDWIDPRIEVRPSPVHGWGMYATAPIRQGEVVTIWGGTLLLTEDDLSGDQYRMWQVEGYVWATIGEGLYLAQQLGPDENDWTDCINHCCDPNVWMSDEVTLVARRDIAAGEELTIDYCLFEGDEDHVPPWTCRCGSARCRGRFTGRDWRRPDLQERYRGHFSPFINARVRELTKDERRRTTAHEA
jgi:hypothetical protein